MANLKIDAQNRTAKGTQLKKLRAAGMVPVTVYGRGIQSFNLQVAERNLTYVMQHGGGSRLVEVDVQGDKKHNVLVREVQRHPVNHRPIHADFYAVRMDEKQEVEVPVHGIGRPLASASDLMVLQNREAVTIEALPADLPAVIEVDLTNLSPDHPITVNDLPKLSGVTYLVDEHDFIFTMTSVVDSSAETAETTATAEPEVVKKGKQDEEAAE